MGSDAGHTDLGRIPPQHLPDDLFAELLAGNSAAIYWPEHMASADSGGGCPRADRQLHPRRHRRGTNTAVLSDEIDDAPTAIALLDMREGEPCHFRTAQSASEKDGEDGAIAKATRRRDVGCV